MFLYLTILLPLIAALAVVLRPARAAKPIALAGTLIPLAVVGYLFAVFNWDQSAAFQFSTADDVWLYSAAPGIGALGFHLSVGVDSVALLLIGMTALLGPICVLGSYSAITERVKSYYAWLLVLQAAMTGVFAARDLLLFYICFEFTLIPMWVLISVYGSTNRRKAGLRFFLYTFTGSMIALAGLVYVVWYFYSTTGRWTLDIGVLEAAARMMSPAEQGWVLLALLCGFGVKVPLFPVHTWLPLAHTEAPAAGSVILAAVLLKLGTYGIYRFVLPFVPVAVHEYSGAIAVLCIIGILYAGLICWVQTDIKKLIAYSSVAHLGFCVLGLVAINGAGLSGSVLYMLNHGLSTGALFLLIGMMYERYHTRSMKELGGLAARMPVWATFMVFFVMASVGLPGLNGFISEFLCILGAFQAGGAAWWGGVAGATALPGGTWGALGPWYGFAAATGVIVAAMYLLYMLGRICWGPLAEPHGHGGAGPVSDRPEGGAAGHLPTDLSAREIGILLPLAVLCLGIGVYPAPLLRALEDPVARTVRIVREANGAGGSGGGSALRADTTAPREDLMSARRADLPGGRP
ncbi:MAG: NADH-quinone oxidoreductase subunit M [Phycisphaerales bacterium]|nr:NADH-quinone oxidoreductase subunit M [Phycisphaerales bacterium]